jgi:translation initiation factor 2D
MQPQLLVTRGAARLLRKGALPPVHISAERRSGSKKVTKVAGLEAYLVDVEACAAELRSKLACSTTVGELPGKNNPGHEVVCQGAVVDKVRGAGNAACWVSLGGGRVGETVCSVC